MAFKAPTAKLDLGGFIAALTATDQLTDADKRTSARDERQRRKTERYEAWMDAEALYGAAYGYHFHAAAARVLSKDEAKVLTAQHNATCLLLIEAVSRWMRVPRTDKYEAAKLRAFVKRAKQVFGASTHWKTWADLSVSWAAELA